MECHQGTVSPSEKMRGRNEGISEGYCVQKLKGNQCEVTFNIVFRNIDDILYDKLNYLPRSILNEQRKLCGHSKDV